MHIPGLRIGRKAAFLFRIGGKAYGEKWNLFLVVWGMCEAGLHILNATGKEIFN
jgi:hypothetical protein